jgi:hypothetical protein
MSALLSFFRTKQHSWSGCRPLTAAERMARYSPPTAEQMQQRENAGAAAPKAKLVDGGVVLVALPGRVNRMPNQLPNESHANYEARMEVLRKQRLCGKDAG